MSTFQTTNQPSIKHGQDEYKFSLKVSESGENLGMCFKKNGGDWCSARDKSNLETLPKNVREVAMKLVRDFDSSVRTKSDSGTLVLPKINSTQLTTTQSPDRSPEILSLLNKVLGESDVFVHVGRLISCEMSNDLRVDKAPNGTFTIKSTTNYIDTNNSIEEFVTNSNGTILKHIVDETVTFPANRIDLLKGQNESKGNELSDRLLYLIKDAYDRRGENERKNVRR